MTIGMGVAAVLEVHGTIMRSKEVVSDVNAAVEEEATTMIRATIEVLSYHPNHSIDSNMISLTMCK
jgi:hypothetical protein